VADVRRESLAEHLVEQLEQDQGEHQRESAVIEHREDPAPIGHRRRLAIAANGPRPFA